MPPDTHFHRVTETKVNARAVSAGRVVCVCLPPAHRPSRFSGVEAKTTARAWHTQGDKTPDCRMMCRRRIIHALEGSLNPASSRRVVGFAHASEAVRQAEPLLASSHAEINTCGCGDQDHARAHACRYATMPPSPSESWPPAARRPFRRSQVDRWPAPAPAPPDDYTTSE